MPSITRDNWPAARDRILASIPSPGNRETVRRYLAERQARGVRPSTLAAEANAMRSLAQALGDKALETVQRMDLVDFANSAKRMRGWRNLRNDGSATVTQREVALEPSTLAVRLGIVKGFYRWLRGTDEDPPETKGLVVKRRKHDSIPTDQLITRSDLKAMIQAHPDPRDRALVAVLFDSGLRASELCALNVGSVAFDEYGAVLMLPKDAQNLKTGARRVRLHESVPFLHAWYEAHPQKHDAKAALFHTRSHRAMHLRITSGALWAFVKHAGKRAGLSKHVHPHLFRHSAATERARLGWTEGMMRAFFGWSRTSDMPSVYVHLAGGDYERMDLERRGLLKDGDVAKPALEGMRCPSCKAPNILTDLFCKACRTPMTPAAEAAVAQQRVDQIQAQVRQVLGELTVEPFHGTVVSRAMTPNSRPMAWREVPIQNSSGPS